MKGKHGEPSRNTEVPRIPLMEALGAESNLHSTELLESPNSTKTSRLRFRAAATCRDSLDPWATRSES